MSPNIQVTPAGQPAQCRRCSKEIALEAVYCSFCGAVQRAVRISLRGWVVIISLALLVGCALWTAQQELAGELPSQPFQAAQAGASSAPPLPQAQVMSAEDLDALRKATQDNPDSLEAWSALTSALLNHTQAAPDAAPDLLFEAIEALKQILRIDPVNQAALLSMAEISFRRQVFDKAAEYYARYLAERPEDLRARARLGSTYTFMNNAAKAEQELRNVLSVDSQHFEANAYLAIVLMQAGRQDEAREFGRIALQHAPNEEAKSRLASFLGETPPRKDADRLAPVISFLRSHPVAGPKFVGVEDKEGEIQIYFRDFPMHAMPEPVREKFVQEVLNRIEGEAPVQFLDSVSGSLLHSVKK